MVKQISFALFPGPGVFGASPFSFMPLVQPILAYMQLVTPSVVPTAVRTAIITCKIVFQTSFFIFFFLSFFNG